MMQSLETENPYINQYSVNTFQTLENGQGVTNTEGITNNSLIQRYQIKTRKKGHIPSAKVNLSSLACSYNQNNNSNISNFNLNNQQNSERRLEIQTTIGECPSIYSQSKSPQILKFQSRIENPMSLKHNIKPNRRSMSTYIPLYEEEVNKNINKEQLFKEENTKSFKEQLSMIKERTNNLIRKLVQKIEEPPK
jgi:hypothetical protein